MGTLGGLCTRCKDSLLKWNQKGMFYGTVKKDGTGSQKLVWKCADKSENPPGSGFVPSPGQRRESSVGVSSQVVRWWRPPAHWWRQEPTSMLGGQESGEEGLNQVCFECGSDQSSWTHCCACPGPLLPSCLVESVPQEHPTIFCPSHEQLCMFFSVFRFLLF